MMKTNMLQPAPTCDLNDAYPDKVRPVTLPFNDYGGRKMFAGRVRTIVTVDDTELVQQALINTPGEGGVIVLDGGGSQLTALIGDVYGEVLRKNGWAGIVINGCVRDTAMLAKIDVGIKALGHTPIRSSKTGMGAIDVPLAFGSVYFQTGQCIYCDEDGVLVSDDPLTL